MNCNELINKRVSIKPCNSVVSTLFGVQGSITKTKTEDLTHTREFFGRSIERCPDEVSVWVQFDEPLQTEGHLKGWKGIWISYPSEALVIESNL